MTNRCIREELIKSCRKQGYNLFDIFENYYMLVRIQNKNDSQLHSLAKSEKKE